MEDKHKKIYSQIMAEIIEAVSKLKYGEVVITVYDSKVVQIEKKEKKGFT